MKRLSKNECEDLLREVSRELNSSVEYRDLAYAMLTTLTDDRMSVFTLLMGQERLPDFGVYDSSELICRLSSLVQERIADKDEGISFDELKRGMVEDMKALIALRDRVNEDGSPTLDASTMASVVARIADIRVKLTSKFGTTERNEEQRVIVNQKYNSVCPHCGREYSRNLSRDAR